MFLKKGVLKDLAEFTGKHLYQSLFFNKVTGAYNFIKKDSETFLDTGRKLNVHKALRRCPGRLLNVLCAFNLRPVSRGTSVFL